MDRKITLDREEIHKAVREYLRKHHNIEIPVGAEIELPSTPDADAGMQYIEIRY